MSNFNQRVADWNEARFDREYSNEQTVRLLREEWQEYLDAETDVDQLDALCDVIYVCEGAKWKLHYEGDFVGRAISNNVDSAVFLAADGIELLAEAVVPPAECLEYIVVVIYTEMLKMLKSHAACISALIVVCDSNDSKVVKKIATEAKAGKGDSFIAPEPRLRELLESVQ